MHEVTLTELVLNEAVGGAAVRYAQQGFRQDHQRQALLAGERELAQQVLDAAETIVAGANGIDQTCRRAVDPGVLFRGQASALKQLRCEPAVVSRVGRHE